MNVLITAIPLFDDTMTVRAYRLMDQSGDKALSVKNDFRGRSEALAAPGLELIAKVGLEPFAGDSPLLVEIGRLQLMMGAPANLGLAPSQLVCCLPGGLPNDADLLEKCAALKAQGYTIALDDFPLSGLQSPYFAYADFLILDYKNMRFPDVFRAVSAQLPGLQIIIAGVPNVDTYQSLCADATTKKALFSGDFYRQPITKGVHSISPIKINALQLLRMVNEDDFELADIAKIVERDPALTISLLRFINSQAAKLNRKVDSIQSAVAIMGQQELRHWATVAISVGLAEDRPGEITKLSLVRAKFAENLAGTFELGIFQPQLFMTGLFSLLDVILEKPMEQAIQEVSVDQRVYDALVNKSGELYRVMELVYAYEHANWDDVSILIIRNNIKVDAVCDAFVDALVWYHQLLNTIDG